MSRRNRYKFRDQNAHQSTASAGTTSQSPAPAARASGNSGAFAQHAGEYRTIRNDMIRLVVLNGIMLIAVFVLYYINRSSGIVEKLFHQLF